MYHVLFYILTIIPSIQLTHAFTPSTLLIRNDSHLHAHHAAMEGSTSKETHFQYADALPGTEAPSRVFPMTSTTT